jgi:sugar lactone lactonase YvrE
MKRQNVTVFSGRQELRPRTRPGLIVLACLGSSLLQAPVHAQTPAAVTTLTRSSGFAVDGTGSLARFQAPGFIARAADGTLYVSDASTTKRIRAVTPAGVVTTRNAPFPPGYPVGGLFVDGGGNLFVFQQLLNGLTRIAPDDTTSSWAMPPGFSASISVAAMGPSGEIYINDSTYIWKLTASGVGTKLAGGGQVSPTTAPVDGPLGVASIGFPSAMAADAAGNLYLGDGNQIIRKVTPDGVITTIAGAFRQNGSTDGPALSARFLGFGGMLCDAAGNLLFTDGQAIRRLSSSGVVSTVAGTAGTSGYRDGSAAEVLFSAPRGIAIDPAGNIFVADAGNSVIRQIAPSGDVTTLAGLAGSTTSSLPVMDTVLPKGVAAAPGAKTYVSDTVTHAIRRLVGGVNPGVFAGRTGEAGSADGGASVTASFHTPRDIGFDTSGNLYVADDQPFDPGTAIRRIAPDGTVTTFAGSLTAAGTADGTGASARFTSLKAMAQDAAGNFFMLDGCAVRKVTVAAEVTTVAGQPNACVLDSTHFWNPVDLAVGPDGTVYVAELYSIQSVSPSGTISVLAGARGSPEAPADGSGSAARFVGVRGLAIDSAGTMYVTDSGAIRRVTAAGGVTTVAGVPTPSASTDGAGSNARFSDPRKLAVAADGTIYIADNFRIRTMTAAGVVGTLAGGTGGVADGVGSAAQFTSLASVNVGPDGLLYTTESDRTRSVDPATGAVTTLFVNAFSGPSADGFIYARARFKAPTGIVAASDGTLVVADTGNHTIRRIVSGLVSTLAGTAGSVGSTDATGAAARFNAPQGVAIDSAGNVFVADTGNNAVRMISPVGVVTTVATGFSAPKGIAVDAAGTLYVADTGNHVIKTVAPGGSVSVLAGTVGVSGSSDGVGAAARFSGPTGMALRPDGSLAVTDTGNHTLRLVTAAGVVSTTAGTAQSSGQFDGTGAVARFNGPEAVAADASGALFVADTINGVLRLALVGGGSAPVITQNPIASAVVNVHDSLTLTCAATGSPVPTIQWTSTLANGFSAPTISSGRDTGTLTLSDIGAVANGNGYGCVATNTLGNARSSTTSVTVRVLTLSSTTLTFGGVVNPAGGYSPVTPPQTIDVGWTGPGAPAWKVTTVDPWVTITGGSGAGAGRFTIGVTNPPPVAIGFSGATLSFTSSDEPQFNKTVSVHFFASSSNAAPPIGVIDTPANSATGLQGSLAVTGWALDDIDIDHVEIWRDAAAGETTPVYGGSGPGNGKIFIANAMFVPGARPDIETLYGGSRPGAHSAGWGYMLLTQGLWNQGNGTYTLYAFAFDKAGNSATIGTKTIGVDNAHGTKPFGTIDTPSYGGTVSGVIQNFGWALTPGSTCTIANPNVQVSFDSGALTPVVYGDARTDVAGAFPAYTNAAAAGGHYTLDTTTLTNGMHTIGWFVTDSCGRADGMGSRFFTVANSSSMATVAPAVVAARAPRDWALVRGTTVSDPPPAMADGTRVVRVDQSERIELQLPGDTPYTASELTLPLGSSFDASEGKFYWQPAAGFLGAYDLQFTAGSRVENVRVVVGPPIRMVIDTPHAGNVLKASGFTVAGWAVDLASLDGGGIDTLHVWAYPVGGGVPEFVGVARSGGARPDVAVLYGPSFGNGGYTLSGRLAPGTYDLVVFAHSAASNSFAAAETVRVIVR